MNPKQGFVTILRKGRTQYITPMDVAETPNCLASTVLNGRTQAKAKNKIIR